MSNSINSGHQNHSTVTNNAIELASFTKASNAPGTSAAGTNTVQSPEDRGRHQEIGRIAHYLQQQFPGGDEEGGIRGLIEDRAGILHNEMHLSLDDVKDMINKAHKLDRITSSVEGGMGAIGYAASSAFPKDTVNKLMLAALSSHGLPGGAYASTFLSGASGGGVAVAIKALLQKPIENGLKDTKWMEADRDALEPAMQRIMDNRNTHGHQLKHAMMGGMGFNARNVVTNVGIGPVMHSKGKSLSYGQGVGQNLPATLMAGSLSGVVQNTRFANKLHGPEFLLGRTDWRDRCQALLDTSATKQMTSGTLARGKAMISNLPTKETAAGILKNTLSPVQWAEDAALAAGLGATDVAMLAMRSAMGSGTASFAAQQAIGLLPSALSYAAQGVAGTEMNRLVGDKYNNFMDSLFGTGKSKDKGKGPAEEAVTQHEDRTNRMSGVDTHSPADIEASDSSVKTPPNEPVTATVATPPQDETSEIASVHTQPPADTEASGSGVETPPNEPVTATVATPPQDETNEVASVHTQPPADIEASGSGVETPPNEPVTATVATPPQDPSNEVEITGEDSPSPTTQQTYSRAPGTAVPHPAGETILARDLQRQHSARFGDPFDNASLPTRPAPARLREDRNALHLQNMLNQQASERLSGSDLTDSVVTKPPRAKLRD